MSLVHALLDQLVRAFAPRRCAGCERVCEQPICVHCGQLLAALGTPPPQRDARGVWVAAYEYREPLRQILHKSKYGAARGALATLAEVAAARLAVAEGDALVPVPLGPRRLRQRGYNQAVVFASGIAARSEVPIRAALHRVRETRPQTGLDAGARRANLAGAFAWRGPSLRGGRVWVVDDVITTGATAAAAREALVRAGAAVVNVCAIAMAGAPGKPYDRTEWLSPGDGLSRSRGGSGAGDHRRAAPRSR